MTADVSPGPTSDFDVLDDEFVADPHAVYARLRAKHPVAHTDRYGGYWLITRYDDVREAARNTDAFSSRGGIVIPDVGNPLPFLPIELDPPEHSQYRKPLQAWFSVSRLMALQDDIREMARERLEPIVDRGHADLCAELAGPIPPMVIARLLGLDKSDWPMFRGMAAQMVTAAESGDAEANTEAMSWLFGFMTQQIVLRQNEPRDDLLTFMTQLKIDGAPISDQDVIGLALFTLIAGHETTTGAIGSMLMHLARDPAAQQRLRDEPAIIAKAVEEVLRIDPPVPNLARTVTQQVTVSGVRLGPGDRVLLSWASANRDAAAFTDPDTMIVDRPNNNHLAFGSGIHRCLGANLARLEMRIVVEELLARIPTFGIADGAEVVVGGVLARGPRVLPISW